MKPKEKGTFLLTGNKDYPFLVGTSYVEDKIKPYISGSFVVLSGDITYPLLMLPNLSSLTLVGLEPTSVPQSIVPAEIPQSEDAEEEYEIMVTPDGLKYIVDPAIIVGGGPPKDGIPSIDFPKYVSLQEADAWIQDNELVLAIIYKGVIRVYPLQIMVWHEIVNDSIAGDPLLITY